MAFQTGTPLATWEMDWGKPGRVSSRDTYPRKSSQIAAVTIAAVASFIRKIDRLEIGRTSTNDAVYDVETASVRFPIAPPASPAIISGTQSKPASSRQPRATSSRD